MCPGAPFGSAPLSAKEIAKVARTRDLYLENDAKRRRLNFKPLKGSIIFILSRIAVVSEHTLLVLVLDADKEDIQGVLGDIQRDGAESKVAVSLRVAPQLIDGSSCPHLPRPCHLLTRFLH